MLQPFLGRHVARREYSMQGNVPVIRGVNGNGPDCCGKSAMPGLVVKRVFFAGTPHSLGRRQRVVNSGLASRGAWGQIGDAPVARRGNSKQTSRSVAKAASRILRNKSSSKDAKKVAGSALAQTRKK